MNLPFKTPAISGMLSVVWLFLSVALNAQEYDKQERVDCNQLRQYIFSWQFIDQCGMQVRGGSSRGADVTLAEEPHPDWLALQEPGIKDFQLDRRAILAMAGPYRTTFDFLEIVGYRPDFKPAAPYQSWGTEYVYVIADTGDFISLQHIMVMMYKEEDGTVSEPLVMKHWRQDWQYEKRDILVYAGNSEREHQKYSAGKSRGTWAQAVYQVDDSPRYEAIGRWRHLPNFSTWESEETWRPLPRRESSVRDDYDVLIGTNSHTITPAGWVHEQENYKTRLNAQGQPEGDAPYLAKEIGVNRYERIKDFDFAAGDRYWQRTASFWADVRESWREIIDSNKRFTLKKSVDGVPLFSPLFAYAQEVYDTDDYEAAEGKAFIENTLRAYVEE
ncbi:hypothetical protein CWI75_01420 [Kineobactrum sediminis]|uniref:Uncharacterized protein n=1 Tax=Kineobactrum sediminis TaxID=1905677 RepID=A0A2N5Y6Q0_9GAMM|nr:DUF6607 family protein [Kineobactrum sediminis]PLW84039.1 hypothetical protein CWI75_01420 [Kineobactrum sediminis]